MWGTTFCMLRQNCNLRVIHTHLYPPLTLSFWVWSPDHKPVTFTTKAVWKSFHPHFNSCCYDGLPEQHNFSSRNIAIGSVQAISYACCYGSLFFPNYMGIGHTPPIRPQHYHNRFAVAKAMYNNFLHGALENANRFTQYHLGTEGKFFTKWMMIISYRTANLTWTSLNVLLYDVAEVIMSAIVSPHMHTIDS